MLTKETMDKIHQQLGSEESRTLFKVWFYNNIPEDYRFKTLVDYLDIGDWLIYMDGVFMGKLLSEAILDKTFEDIQTEE